jgi:glycosyltransferase involved in cell wall biosynthesis
MDAFEHEFASVIIPHYNDSVRLRNCLQALANQSYPKESFEIIVVDNCSDHDPSGIVTSFENARLLIEYQPGSYAARNKGIAEAKGKILAFTDSDAVPEATWLEKGVSLFHSTHNCGFVAGKVDVYSKDPDKPNAFERYEKAVSHRQEDYIGKHNFGATVNLFSSKQVYEKVGLFDANLKSRGDLEWGQRVVNSGYIPVYTEEAVVRHPARRSLRELFKRNVRLAGGRVDQRRYSKLPLISMRYLLNLMLPPFKEIITMLTRKNRYDKLQHKVALLGILVFVHYVSSIETLRVLIGGKSVR